MSLIQGLKTGKMARYTGRGDNPARFVIGDHAPPKSPMKWFPWDPYLAMTVDEGWFYRDYRSGYNANEWTVTAVGAGSVAATTDLGILMTNAGADNDLQQLQHLYTWTPGAGGFCAFYARVLISDGLQSDFFAGWSSTDTSIVASAPADYAMFKKDDGDTIVNGATNDGGGTPTETANLITDFDAVPYDLGVVLVATSATAGTAYFQYKEADSRTWNQAAAKTTDFPDAAVRPTFLIQNGEAAAKTLTIQRWAFAGYEVV